MKFIGIIPARYASTRFPGKPLAMIGSQTMIERVYRRACLALDEVVVATDDERIASTVANFGGRAIMTSPNHQSGTDRCYEAYCLSGSQADAVINIQGDEPFIDPKQINQLKESLEAGAPIATLIRKFDPAMGFEALFDSNTPKVVTDAQGHALYFSRSIIPYVRTVKYTEWLDTATFYTHVGLYGYRAEVLAELVKMPRSPLEIAESLEQLRWLQGGYQIQTAVTDCPTIGIDTPEDLARAIESIKES
jgi:3-deoxy-manno-octulosonate cytidylyltransferase (CMP-KDO synthetase)